MDLFLLPSKFEGLGLVFLEAQANGLPCLGSNEVPKDTEITELMHRLSLEEGAEKWGLEIERLLNSISSRQSCIKAFGKAGYDINYEKHRLADIYNSVLN